MAAQFTATYQCVMAELFSDNDGLLEVVILSRPYEDWLKNPHEWVTIYDTPWGPLYSDTKYDVAGDRLAASINSRLLGDVDSCVFTGVETANQRLTVAYTNADRQQCFAAFNHIHHVRRYEGSLMRRDAVWSGGLRRPQAADSLVDPLVSDGEVSAIVERVRAKFTLSGGVPQGSQETILCDRLLRLVNAR